VDARHKAGHDEYDVDAWHKAGTTKYEEAIARFQRARE
jgi:hypothetical protein